VGEVQALLDDLHRLLKNVRRYAEVAYKPIKGQSPMPA
jgi:hypothetical protein